ncbi:hypothetical protein H9I32_01735 [Bacillus sp. Xin]|uniref:hypothetical protein n=1 Tax=unclassified Bacillus (in: firmicutes) TaxID=185979 RepID=UPI0015728B37|nr:MULTISPECIES: hypothetical protein [unclassified Bacillus (in: firmicutes)]MBC6971183.1 hypothetical protein [Bacillus sp. Xin]NSW38124.1 hypothetical protein [Bacillus sp. Xin1]
MPKRPLVFTVPPNSKVKVSFFSRYNKEIKNISFINQLLKPERRTLTEYPDYKRYSTEVQSLSDC